MSGLCVFCFAETLLRFGAGSFRVFTCCSSNNIRRTAWSSKQLSPTCPGNGKSPRSGVVFRNALVCERLARVSATGRFQTGRHRWGAIFEPFSRAASRDLAPMILRAGLALSAPCLFVACPFFLAVMLPSISKP